MPKPETSALVALPLPEVWPRNVVPKRSPELRAAVIHGSAIGKSKRQMAAELKTSRSTVRRIAESAQDRIRSLQEELREKAAHVLRSRLGTAMRAQLDAASDPTVRHGPQSLRVALEAAGLLDRNVHVGDVHQSLTVNVDAERLREPPDLDALEEARRALGAG